MPQSIIAVTYQLTVPVDDFRAQAASAARQIARAPGLRWKIWGLDPNTGTGTSFYLFDSEVATIAFANGPAIVALRDDPATIHVTVRIAPVDEHLSGLTFGTAPLQIGKPADVQFVP